MRIEVAMPKLAWLWQITTGRPAGVLDSPIESVRANDTPFVPQLPVDAIYVNSRPSSDPESDIELLARVRTRDQDAMGIFFDRYSRLIYDIAFRILGQEAEAEGVMQDLLMDTWHRPPSLDIRSSSLGPQLSVAAYRSSIKRKRTERTQNC